MGSIHLLWSVSIILKFCSKEYKLSSENMIISDNNWELKVKNKFLFVSAIYSFLKNSRYSSPHNPDENIENIHRIPATYTSW